MLADPISTVSEGRYISDAASPLYRKVFLFLTILDARFASSTSPRVESHDDPCARKQAAVKRYVIP